MSTQNPAIHPEVPPGQNLFVAEELSPVSRPVFLIGSETGVTTTPDYARSRLQCDL
jgi:hypothetical protein